MEPGVLATWIGGQKGLHAQESHRPLFGIKWRANWWGFMGLVIFGLLIWILATCIRSVYENLLISLYYKLYSY